MRFLPQLIFTTDKPHFTYLFKMVKKNAVKKAVKKAGKPTGKSGKKDSSSSSSSSSSSKKTNPKKKPNVTSGPPSPSSMKKVKKMRGSDDESDDYKVKRNKQELAEREETLAALKSARTDLKKAKVEVQKCVAQGRFKSDKYKYWSGKVEKLEFSVNKLEDTIVAVLQKDKDRYSTNAENEQANEKPVRCEKMEALLEAMGSAKPNNGLYDLSTVADQNGFENAKYILTRRCYNDFLKWAGKDKTWDTGVCGVGGTPGIGKTTFRYWALLQWVQGNNPWLNKYTCIVFFVSIAEIYQMKRTGDKFEATLIRTNIFSPTNYVSDSLGLLEINEDVASLMSGADHLSGMRHAIFCGSPGAFKKKKQGRPQLFKEALMASKMQYFPLWSKEEVVKLPRGFFKWNKASKSNTLWKKELYEMMSLYGGVLQFIRSNREYAEGEIASGINEMDVHKAKRLLIPNVAQMTPSGTMIHHILKVETSGAKVGVATDFISTHVARRVVDILKTESDEIFTKFIKSMVSYGGPAKSFVGLAFENAFESKFVRGKVKLQISNGVTLSSSGSAVYDDKVSTPQIKKDILYRPSKSNFHGLDFFILKGKHLYLLKTTVGSQKQLNFCHPDILKLIIRLNNNITKRTVLYILPSLQTKFNLPSPLYKYKLKGKVITKKMPATDAVERTAPDPEMPEFRNKEKEEEEEEEEEGEEESSSSE